MRGTIYKAVFLSLCAPFLCAFTGCSTKSNVPVRKIESTTQLSNQMTALDRSILDKTEDGWTVILGETQVKSHRNPFRGFNDVVAQNTKVHQAVQSDRESDLQLPEQMYPTREYKVVGVITGTADPKVYIMDPGGNRFILRRGSLIGNNNGSIASIRRDSIEVYERVADKGQYIELPLYEDADSKGGSSIKLSLQ